MSISTILVILIAAAIAGLVFLAGGPIVVITFTFVIFAAVGFLFRNTIRDADPHQH